MTGMPITTSRLSLIFMGLLPMVAIGQESMVAFRSTAFVGEREYQVDVVRDKQPGVAHLQIACRHGCSAVPSYREDFVDRPLYLMQPKDGVDRVVSVWTTGSAYRIVAYRLGEAGVRKVLDRGSRTPPAISFDEGREMLKLCASECVVWHWSDNKHAYVE